MSNNALKASLEQEKLSTVVARVRRILADEQNPNLGAGNNINHKRNWKKKYLETMDKEIDICWENINERPDWREEGSASSFQNCVADKGVKTFGEFMAHVLPILNPSDEIICGTRGNQNETTSSIPRRHGQ